MSDFQNIEDGLDNIGEGITRLQAENARLRALNAELVEALSDLLFLFSTDTENSVDAYERVAERFHAETGMLAPGKSQAAELVRPTFEERQDAYRKWMAGFKIRARTVLSRARAENTGGEDG